MWSIHWAEGVNHCGIVHIMYDDTDHYFEILNKEPLSRDTSEIAVSVNGMTLTLVKSDRSWVPDSFDGQEREWGMAIGRLSL